VEIFELLSVPNLSKFVPLLSNFQKWSREFSYLRRFRQKISKQSGHTTKIGLYLRLFENAVLQYPASVGGMKE